MPNPIVRSLYRGLLRHASVYGFDDAARQLALARFAEFIPPGVQLAADGSDDAVDVVRRSFRAPVRPLDDESETAAQATRMNLGFTAMKAMGEDESDLVLHAMWTKFLVPPRKLPQMRVTSPQGSARGAGSWRMLPRRSTPPTPLTPKSMVRELRVFVIVSTIVRWAQIQYKARAATGDRRPSADDLLKVAPLDRFAFDTLTHAIRFEAQRLTEAVQRDVDAYAAEVVRRLETKNIRVADSVRCNLFPTEACVLNPPSVDDEAKRMAQLRPHLGTIFETIMDVVLGPTSSIVDATASAVLDGTPTRQPQKLPGREEAGVPPPLRIGVNRPVEDAAVADATERERRAVMVSEVRLHCLDDVLDTREAAEPVAAAFVMSVAVRLGLRRCRLVHRRSRVHNHGANTTHAHAEGATTEERFVVFVDGPLACDPRGGANQGPLVVDLRKRTVLRCTAASNDGQPSPPAEEGPEPINVPAADRRTAIALLRRMRREAKQTVDEQRLAAAKRKRAMQRVAESVTLPPVEFPGGFHSSSTLAAAHGVLDNGQARDFDHDSLQKMHAQLSADEDEWLRDEDNDEDDDDDFNAGGVDQEGEAQDDDDEVATLGTVMPPKVLAAYLCSHLLVVGASQGVAEPAKQSGQRVASTVGVALDDGETVRYVKAPDPAVLANDEAWRLLRSQIIFLGGLP